MTESAADIWHDLSDDELRSRLVEHGMATEDALSVVHWRDEEWATKAIYEALSS